MKINKELTKGSTAMLVLSVISKRDMYGYQIIKVIGINSDSVFEMNEGTLYPILHALEADKCLESYWCEAEGRRRKYYKITDKGLKQLAEKEKEWKEFSTAVGKVLGGAELVGV